MKQTVNRFTSLPHTRAGWWAVGLAGLFLALFIFNSAVLIQPSEPVPIPIPVRIAYGFIMLLCGIASGAAGLVAVIRARERSWMAWLTILPGLFVLFLLIGEFLFPH
jgi:hypothetical protein